MGRQHIIIGDEVKVKENKEGELKENDQVLYCRFVNLVKRKFVHRIFEVLCIFEVLWHSFDVGNFMYIFLSAPTESVR